MLLGFSSCSLQFRETTPRLRPMLHLLSEGVSGSREIVARLSTTFVSKCAVLIRNGVACPRTLGSCPLERVLLCRFRGCGAGDSFCFSTTSKGDSGLK